MKINKINYIKETEAFNNFVWDRSLPEFKKRNLIYGWNGSGKTSLSRVFKLLENIEEPENGEIKITLENGTITERNFSDTKLVPLVRVFNRDFVDNNVFNEENSGSVSKVGVN